MYFIILLIIICVAILLNQQIENFDVPLPALSAPATATIPKTFIHNPTLHRAPGKGKNSSTLPEAHAVCRAKGKKVCSASQLKDAISEGYRENACGWTDTQINPGQYLLGNGGNATTNCKTDIWSNEEADIYCCDRFVYSPDFAGLDKPFRMARIWIAMVEQKFEELYDEEIPKNTVFIAFSDSTGDGISVKKTDNHKYSLQSNPSGSGQSKAQIPKTTGLVATAVFAVDLPDYNIKAGQPWPQSSNNLIRYGSTTQLQNSSVMLTGSPNKYADSGLRMAVSVATATSNANSVWLLKAQRGLGAMDSEGFGDEQSRFGEPIKNGSIIRLENKESGYNLSCSNIFKSPDGKGFQVHLHKKGARGDTNDHWRIETGGPKFWYATNPIYIVHVNTACTLCVQSQTIRATSLRQTTDRWSAIVVQLAPVQIRKCRDLLNRIATAREYVRSGVMSYKKELDNSQTEYNKSCYKISRDAYNNLLAPKLKEVSVQQELLETQKQMLQKLQTDKETVAKTTTGLQTQLTQKQRDLEKLRLKGCKPVRQCLKDLQKTGSVSKQCTVLLPFLDGKVSADLINQIHKTMQSDDYDIRTHKDYHKLAKITDIQPCYKI